MISTTYEVMQEVGSPEGAIVTLKVIVVDEVIGVNEGYKNTTVNKVVASLPSDYSTLDLVNAIQAEGYNL